MKNIVITFLLLAFVLNASAQGSAFSFIDLQKSFPRPNEALLRKEDTLRKQFEAKGFEWPAKYVYIRSFKYDSQLEVWIKNKPQQPYTLFKTYKVCALAGTLGPKRMEGDYQVPEGFYFINEFNPRSSYYLSLGINYPNSSDKILSDTYKPGGDIKIHGSCVTVGCIPVTDQQIDELYILAAHAKSGGQDFIPVHIFPIKYNNPKSAAYLEGLTRTDSGLKLFAQRLESVYDHFEITHQLPVIMTNAYGEYVFDGLAKKPAPVPKPKRVPVPHKHKEITDIAEAVHQWPQFPGGGNFFLQYLEKMGNALVKSLPDGKKKAFVMVEFIVDKDGEPTNFKMIKGVNEDFDDELITVLEQMPTWQPALLNDQPVAKKIRQSFAIE